MSDSARLVIGGPAVPSAAKLFAVPQADVVRDEAHKPVPAPDLSGAHFRPRTVATEEPTGDPRQALLDAFAARGTAANRFQAASNAAVRAQQILAECELELAECQGAEKAAADAHSAAIERWARGEAEKPELAVDEALAARRIAVDRKIAAARTSRDSLVAVETSARDALTRADGAIRDAINAVVASEADRVAARIELLEKEAVELRQRLAGSDIFYLGALPHTERAHRVFAASGQAAISSTDTIGRHREKTMAEKWAAFKARLASDPHAVPIFDDLVAGDQE